MKFKFLMYAVAVGGLVLAGCGSGTLTDKRDGKKYRTIKIGNQTWMAENLNVETPDSWCYEDNADNCKKYGRLYTWDAATSACPVGWHLPISNEWGGMVSFASGQETAGTKLKSRPPDWDGTDDLGFSALPGGYCAKDVSCYNLGSGGYWWTNTKYDSDLAFDYRMDAGNASVDKNYFDKDLGRSVRCVQD
jgi:uncharacterized protein (TIGR02145 family)